MPCPLPLTLSDIPVVGYLVAARCPKNDALPWAEFIELLDDMAPSHEGGALDRYRGIQARRPVDALTGACKVVAKARKGTNGTRYMFRSERRSAVYLVREVFRGEGRKPDYTRLASVCVEGERLVTALEANLHEEDTALAGDILAELTEQYDYARRTFGSGALSAAFRDEVAEAVPLSYDPGHTWRFVLTTQRDRILVMHKIVTWATEQGHMDYSVSTLPLPGLDGMRDALTDAYKEEMERVTYALGAEVTAIRDRYASTAEAPPTEVRMLRDRISSAMETYTTYARALGDVVAGTKGTLLEMQHHMSVLEGRIAELSEHGRGASILDWARVRCTLNNVQSALGDALPDGCDVYPHLRRGADVLSWCVGTGADRRTVAVQTNLTDVGAVHLTIVASVKEVPKKVNALFRRSAVGPAYVGPPAKVVNALTAWFTNTHE